MRLHCFVHDPLGAAKGDLSPRRVAVPAMILCWEALGFGLAYRKGQLSTKVVWIGANLEFSSEGIAASIKASIVEDIVEALDRYEHLHVASHKDIRSFVGRANHAAGLFVTIRPFLHSIWKAMSVDSSGPRNTVRIKQISHALRWLRVFFKDEAEGITRQFSLSDSRGCGLNIEIGTDASPWGIGGWLARDGIITNSFCDRVSDTDLEVFDIKRGSCEGQQTLEGLAILVAMRTWSGTYDSSKYHLQVRGDNVGALGLLLRMRPSSPQQAIIARELALVIVGYSFPPKVVHTPGLAHVIADGLSRMYDPGGAKCNVLQHSALQNAMRTPVPARPKPWYRTLA